MLTYVPLALSAMAVSTPLRMAATLPVSPSKMSNTTSRDLGAVCGGARRGARGVGEGDGGVRARRGRPRACAGPRGARRAPASAARARVGAPSPPPLRPRAAARAPLPLRPARRAPAR